jgi:hypothetical protein
VTVQEFAARLHAALAPQYGHQLSALGDFSDILSSVGDAIGSAGRALMTGVSSIGSGIASAAGSVGSGLLHVLNSPATAQLLQGGAQVYIAHAALGARQVPVTAQNAPQVAYTVNARAQQIAQSLAAQGLDTSSPAMQQLLRDVAATGLTNGPQTIYPPLVTPAPGSGLAQYVPWIAGGGLLLLAVLFGARR